MKGSERLVVAPDAAAWREAAVDAFFAIATDAIRERGRFVAALSGGDTPRPVYERLAAAWREAPGGPLDWSRAHLLWGDERYVPADDPRSNYRMARESLLSRVPIPPENVHRIRTELPGPPEAAADYETALRTLFAVGDGEVPRLDLVFLGLGPDGHTASLFPGTGAADVSGRLATAVHVATLDSWRVTLTLPVLNRAANVIFLVAGADKATMLRAVVEGPAADPPLPAQRVRPRDGSLVWIADRAAAPWAR